MIYKLNKINTPERAIKFCMHARRIHRDYANHPTWCRGNVGSAAHHKIWVERYTEIIYILRKFSGKKGLTNDPR
jgi:hypothetical protein